MKTAAIISILILYFVSIHLNAGNTPIVGSNSYICSGTSATHASTAVSGYSRYDFTAGGENVAAGSKFDTSMLNSSKSSNDSHADRSAGDTAIAGVKLCKTLILKVFLEGLYAGQGLMNQAYDEQAPHFGPGVADQIIIELHSATNYATKIYGSAPVNLDIAGNASIPIPTTLNGSYFLTIRHRNHIETTSAFPVSFAGTQVVYDFSNSASKAYGNNMKCIGGIYMLYAGDESQDGIVDATDMIAIDNDAGNFVTGYVNTDLNGDGLVDSGDMILADNNSRIFVSSMLPPSLVVSTSEGHDITKTNAISGGEVISEGSSAVNARGVCWCTSDHPGMNDSHTCDGSGSGLFTSSISSLSPNTTYYVRAYAINASDTAYGNEVIITTLWDCGFPITINHVTGIVAPVDKVVTYGTVSNLPGEPSKCWITQNLGSDHQADSVNDSSEASAGWYWQFNRHQGYKYEDGIRIPQYNWFSDTPENRDWEARNDPCFIELGNCWRLPTYSEWNNLDSIGNWSNWEGPWISGLKLHAAGYLYYEKDSLIDRGLSGNYWSNTCNVYRTGGVIHISGADAGMQFIPHRTGSSVRCLREIESVPMVSAAVNTFLSTNSAQLEGEVLCDGGSAILARGFCWSSSQNPSVNDSLTSDGNGVGAFESELTGLEPDTRYYFRVYASNNSGTSYGPESSFITFSTFTCGTPLTINHTAGDVAPVNKTVTYNTVSGIPGEPSKCWITQNLGSDHQATKINDASEPSAGWYWQFNRKQGYKHDGVSRIPNTSWNSVEEAKNWQNDNDPCTSELENGWRVPWSSEWFNIDAGGGWSNWAGPWTSVLKIHAAGHLNNGDLFERGHDGYYWSCTQYHSTESFALNFDYGRSIISPTNKTDGFPLRCIRESISQAALPTVHTIDISVISITNAVASAEVISDNGASVLERGICWSSSPFPTISDESNQGGSGVGIYSSYIYCNENMKSYVRAYATNSVGTSYGEQLSFTSLSRTPPIVTTSIITNISLTYATGGGTFIHDGWSNIRSRGVCWSTHPNPSTDDFHVFDSYTYLGSYNFMLNCLTPGTTYYVRAYVTSDLGTGYGDEVSFVTDSTYLFCQGIGVTDIDSNAYSSVIVGSQEWMQENLKTSMYRNGDSIPNVTDNVLWSGLTSGAWCWYNNDSINDTAYGKLYNAYTLDDLRQLCPIGWHLPSDAEWTTLTDYLGGESVAGGKMKEPCTYHWGAPNNYASNASGFTGLPGGIRTSNGTFYNKGYISNWWSPFWNDSITLLMRELDKINPFIQRNNYINEQYGASVRCLKDVPSQVVIPSLTTIEVTNVILNTATSGGNITYDGGAPITSRGICWSIFHYPTLADAHNPDSSGSGAFISHINGILYGTKYFVRAYATNSVGTAYGNEVSFFTDCNGEPCCGNLTFTDIRDGEVYDLVEIGQQCWLKENLKGGYCYDDNPDNCEIYGGLTGGEACPEGWHTPINMEWEHLADYLGGKSVAGGKMKSTGTIEEGTGLWFSPNTGATNSSGFSALPAGYRYSSPGGVFYLGMGYVAHYTSRSINESGCRGIVFLPNNTDDLNISYENCSGSGYISGESVRCVKDCSTTVTSPVPEESIATRTQILWKWRSVEGALGYKFKHCYPAATDCRLEYAIDIGLDTTYLQTDLSCGTPYGNKVWAYNFCDLSEPTILIQSTDTCWTCGEPLIIEHTAGNAAPVDKTLTYETVTGIAGESSKCWITQNLGADHQASVLQDTSEASAGWYWQFNRVQGYKHDGTIRTPNTTWINPINESMDWQNENDPCEQLLGLYWRIPTYSEWVNVNAAGGWETNGPWNSVLKMHAAGYLSNENGSLNNRGFNGMYWGKTQFSNTSAYYLGFGLGGSNLCNTNKESALPLRCISD